MENNPLVLTWSQVPHNHNDNKWHGGLQSIWFWQFVMLHVRECYNLQGLSTIYPLHHRHYCSKNIYFGMRANKIIYQEVSFTKHFLLPKILPNLFTAHCEKFVSFKTLSLTSEWMFTVSFTVSACNEGYPKVPEDFTITEKAPTSAFTLKTLLRHY